jgi:hypothetical protein
LANKEIKQLIEAFFRGNGDDDQQMLDEVMIMDKEERKPAEDRHRRIKS